MFTPAAPYLNVPEWPDDPRAEAVDRFERLGDRLYTVAEQIGRMSRAEWAGAEPCLPEHLAKLRDALDAIEIYVGVP